MFKKTFCHLITLAFVICSASALYLSASAQGAPVNAGYPNDMKPGSVLFFNRYTSNANNPQQGDTQINITNTSQTLAIDIHLFFVDGSSCSIADAFISLTPNGTTSFLISEFDPGVQGYLVAVAVADGPTQFNFLIGDEYIRETDGRTANLGAVAIAKRSAGGVESNQEGALLRFNGIEYEQLPATVALSSFNSQTSDSTLVHLYSPTSNLIIGNPVSTNVFTLVYDDVERSFSTTVNLVCYRSFTLGILRISGGSLNAIVPTGRTGWVRFQGGSRPLLGASLQRGPVFVGGHNLHTVTLLSSYTITVPSF